MLAAIPWPILERIPLVGDLAISPHGIGVAAGFLVGALLMIQRAEKRGMGRRYVEDIPEEVQRLLIRAAIGALIGMRLFFVLTHLDQFADDPLSILAVWEGGLTLGGGIAGAVLVVLPEVVRRDYRMVQLLDSAAPGMAAGIAVGRLGDLAIGDHIGTVAPEWPLAWRCTGNYWLETTNSFGFVPPRPYPVGAESPPVVGCFDVAVHQTALYDALSGAILFGVLLWLERRPRWDGFFLTVFLGWYGVVRFATDFVREDRRFLALTGTQWTLVAVLVALAAWVAWRRPWRDRPWAWSPPEFELPWMQPLPSQGAPAEVSGSPPARTAGDAPDDPDQPSTEGG